MNESSELSIIIPAYNEAESLKILLPALIDFCNQNDWNLIVVNDGSRDNTKEILNTFDATSHYKVVHHKLNKGYGAAIKSGILACETSYAITIDADGQHRLEDVKKLFNCLKKKDADMVVGSRRGIKSATIARGIGKSIIRMLAKMLMTVDIYDINSGMKVFRTDLARKYLPLTPDTMAYSDIITLVFINNRHLVIEEPIVITNRMSGKSTIRVQTAFQTIMEIINILVLFNPMKIFLPISILTFIITSIWGIPLILAGRGVSTGTLLGIISAVIFFVLGLITEQLAQIRRNQNGSTE